MKTITTLDNFNWFLPLKVVILSKKIHMYLFKYFSVYECIFISALLSFLYKLSSGLKFKFQHFWFHFIKILEIFEVLFLKATVEFIVWRKYFSKRIFFNSSKILLSVKSVMLTEYLLAHKDSIFMIKDWFIWEIRTAIFFFNKTKFWVVSIILKCSVWINFYWTFKKLLNFFIQNIPIKFSTNFIIHNIFNLLKSGGVNIYKV